MKSAAEKAVLQQKIDACKKRVKYSHWYLGEPGVCEHTGAANVVDGNMPKKKQLDRSKPEENKKNKFTMLKKIDLKSHVSELIFTVSSSTKTQLKSSFCTR